MWPSHTLTPAGGNIAVTTLVAAGEVGRGLELHSGAKDAAEENGHEDVFIACRGRPNNTHTKDVVSLSQANPDRAT